MAFCYNKFYADKQKQKTQSSTIIRSENEGDSIAISFL